MNRERDIANGLTDLLDSPFTKLPLIVLAPLDHVATAKGRDVFPETLASVQQIDLGPQVLVVQRCWRTGQFDHPVYSGAHFGHRAETSKSILWGFDGVVLERSGLIQHHGVIGPVTKALLDKPCEILPVDDVQVGFLVGLGEPL